MRFKLHEQNGNWAVSRDGDGIFFLDGQEITYDEYTRFKDAPHTLADHYERKNGKIIAKPKNKSS